MGVGASLDLAVEHSGKRQVIDEDRLTAHLRHGIHFGKGLANDMERLFACGFRRGRRLHPWLDADFGSHRHLLSGRPKLLGHSPRRQLHRLQNLKVTGAAAKIPGQCFLYL